ncbi:MAG: GlcNAc-transferase family protein [Actinomycetota bacterium]
MIDVSNDRIFVAIAAYREPELRRTIENCVATAAHPDRLRFGVCLQYDLDGPPETQPDCLDGVDAEISLLRHDWTESKGGCWARHRTQSLYRDEGYTLQIDSHMRMAPNWDVDLITMMEATGAAKPLITGQCPLYEIHDDVDVYPADPTVPITIVDEWREVGWIHHPAVARPDVTMRLRGTRVLSGMFVFTLGQWNVEVRQDPEHLYTGEELALTIRSFTWGYDLVNPSSVVAWHRLHPEGNHKYIHDGDEGEVQRRDVAAYRRLRLLHAGDPDRILEPYSTGPVRTVAEFAAWSGLDFGARVVSDDARVGVDPAPYEPAW